MSKMLTAMGLMSGTSLDGIDLALVQSDGMSRLSRGPSSIVPYTSSQREVLRGALIAAKDIRVRTERPPAVAAAEAMLTELHGEAVRSFLQSHNMSPAEVDVLGFHGQTVIHRPEQKLTVQIGNGQRLADLTGIRVAHDMRAADVERGGQGAPLVPAYHQALSVELPDKPVAFVNIGGVANVTFVGAGGELLAFDVGPGNALIDDWMMWHTGVPRDPGGAAARQGTVREAIVESALAQSYFQTSGPKSLDRNSFAGIDLEGLSVEDGAATLVEFTCRSIAAGAKHFPHPPNRWIICGGGRHNKAIMARLNGLLAQVATAEEMGFDGDSLEAEAWGYLAIRCLKGLPITFPGTTGVDVPLVGGVIATPASSSRGHR